MFKDIIQKENQKLAEEKDLKKLEDNLIRENYILGKEKTYKGVKSAYYINKESILNQMIIVDNKENRCLLSSRNGFLEVGNDNELVFLSCKKEKFINHKIREAICNINEISVKNIMLYFEQMKTFNLSLNSYSYRNILYDMVNSNIFLSYLISFGTNKRIRLKYTKNILGKAVNLLENQMLPLPLEISYKEEIKILNRIADNLIKSLFENKSLFL